MRNVTGAWIKAEATQELARLYKAAGHQIYFVGGCVRNSLLGAPVGDIDMATDAPPDQGVALATSAGLKVIPTGIEHGTITIVSGGVPHEITTFRTDVKTDGRHADIAFSTDIAEDAARRDFTMNALYADASGAVLDPVGGLPDLEARRVKFVGEPKKRIAEDYLRILRFFRFHAWYGDPSEGIDRDGLAACAQGLDNLHSLSRERVGTEMTKLLSAPDPAPAIAAMAQSGVLNAVMPGADPKWLAPLVHFEAGRAADWRRRVVVLGGEAVKNTWRLSKKNATHLAEATDAIGSTRTIGDLAYRGGARLAVNVALARAAIFETAPDVTLDEMIAQATTAKFPISASDLPHLAGPALGVKLRSLESDWIASDFALTKAALLAL